MDFLLDEGVGAKKLKNLLRKRGHNVKAANEGELRAMKDPPLLKNIAIEEKRFVITYDTTFIKDKDAPPCGVIVIRGDYRDRMRMTSLLAERLMWTIEYIAQKPGGLHGFTEIKRHTRYGRWEMRLQGDKDIVEGLNYIVEQGVKLTEDIQLVSVPVENKREGDELP